MSCQIKGIANLVDPVDLKSRLFGNFDQKFDNVPENELPLQDCFLSLSPSGDILVIAWNTRMVILGSKWDSQESSDVKNKFHIIWDGNVASRQNEWITSLITLPIISNGKSSGGVGTEWTYIAVGLNTGFLQFYTESGGLLLEEQLHNESIINIKCQSHYSPKHAGDTGTLEEIHVLYNTVVCILQGFSLFSTLRAFRNYLARVKANCEDKPPAVSLVCKKWGFKNQDVVNDCEVIGSTSVNTFDHLMTASICGGYNSSYRSSAPQHSLVIATGKKPFIGFHYAFEGASAPILSDVAIAMASKVVSAIGAAVPWFKGNSKNVATSEKLKGFINEPAESMTCRFGVSDILREGDCIIVSPNKLLSIICDAMGRVMLIDNIQGIVLRMWKGYRDAQCGWIQAVEEKNRVLAKSHQGGKIAAGNTLQNRRCKVLFLVIYAPKKGIIDIWGVQNGPKISSFYAGKHGRLLYTNYGLCGLNDMTLKSRNQAQYPCVFIDSLGGMKEITVPFHFALNSHNNSEHSNSSRDTHLFKKLKKFLKEEEFNEDKLINEVTNLCLDIKTNDVQLETIEMLMINKHITPSALLAVVDCFSKQSDSENDASKLLSKQHNRLLKQLGDVIKFYIYIKAQYDQPPEYTTDASDEIVNEKQLSNTLFTSEQEIHRILTLSKTLASMRKSNPNSQSRVTFKEDGETFLNFLSCFDFNSSNYLELKKDVNFDLKCRISKLIFQGCMYSSVPMSNWRDRAVNSNIHPEVLIQFALIYWLTKSMVSSLEVELISFTKILHTICLLNDAEEICTSYNEVSRWWRDVRNILINSTDPFNALTAAMACRAVSITMQKNKDRLQTSIKSDFNENEAEDEKVISKSEKLVRDNVKEDGNSSPEEVSNLNDWESVSKDTCQFSLLIGNLEDVAILNAIVCNSPTLDETTPFYTLPYKITTVSLELVLSKGKGSVSEIVSKWLSSTGVDPALLIDESNTELEQWNLSENSLKFTGWSDEAKSVDFLQQDSKNFAPEIDGDTTNTQHTALAKVLDKVSLLKRYFPYSLNSSVLLANLSWEFIMFWIKDITRLEALETSLNVLRHIPFDRIRHGICCLLWNLHLKKKIESVAKLINKVGKLPKERLCIQDIGLSDTQLTIFLHHCVKFLDIWLNAAVVEDEKYSYIRSEELWEGHTGGPQPLAIVAISQAPAHYDLLMLHWQLASVFYAMSYFNLKVTKPIDNMFHSMAHQYFFRDITDKITIPSYKEDKRDNMRLEFLCRVITATIESIHQETLVNNLNFTEATQWMCKCKDLACAWQLDVDELRIHQVCQLYINGFDRLAEEASFFVNDQERLAAKLLPIAGGRTMAYISKVPDLLKEISRISPNLTTYLKNLVQDSPDTIFTNCSNKDRIELVQKIYRNIPETHHEYHIAQQMLDATSNFEEETSLKSND
ncbi:PREDICTED: rab3 GTPase-activating protein non-catalytic subunit [Ceratosolen solmsi marchali]|uniref:Rab3 GTPase-activating protein non-catalytic subunit n=1 Tax=Ceratosolen solmsi marchali TaxID=326594 RepID=A0AAJ6YQY9_9HYME|nr:PREDICTED: rab3 GTPase-activating protein non-catalytic subunit [Ceratosolen solmsi marchali]